MFKFGKSAAAILGLAVMGSLGISETANAEMVMVAGYVPQAPRPSRPRLATNTANYCTQEVKACPGGAYVGRDPANSCRFKACPAATALN